MPLNMVCSSDSTYPSGLKMQQCQLHCVAAERSTNPFIMLSESKFVLENCKKECDWFFGCDPNAQPGQMLCGDHMPGKPQAAATLLCSFMPDFCVNNLYSIAYRRARCGRTCGLCITT
ncbi:hypothetical protein Ddc_15047 [Ditylenchus destructor]|nr:hypothetical protein Ddc_15047 [Ditylenchus destructor]